jgi:hypothetical protein
MTTPPTDGHVELGLALVTGTPAGVGAAVAARLLARPAVDPSTGRAPVFAPRRATDAPLAPTWGGEIDVTLPLAELPSGDYWVRVTATDDARTVVRDVAIVVEQPEKPKKDAALHVH